MSKTQQISRTKTLSVNLKPVDRKIIMSENSINVETSDEVIGVSVKQLIADRNELNESKKNAINKLGKIKGDLMVEKELSQLYETGLKKIGSEKKNLQDDNEKLHTEIEFLQAQIENLKNTSSTSIKYQELQNNFENLDLGNEDEIAKRVVNDPAARKRLENAANWIKNL